MGRGAPRVENLVKDHDFVAFFRITGDSVHCTTIKAKFDEDEYTIGTLSQAKFGPDR